MPVNAAPIEVFRKFDARLEAGGKMLVMSAAEAAAILRQLVDLLPQRQAIEDGDIGPWLDRTMEMASRRHGISTPQDVFNHVLWHVRRASGIGGSESGAMLSHYAEEGATFQSARDIVQQKLLKAAPSPATRDMQRGVRAEEHIQRIFLEQYKATSRTDLVDLTRGFRPEKAPWIIGTPDDIIAHLNRILIADYKAPSAEVYEKLEQKVSFEYRAQLHHYAIVVNAAGIKFSGLALAPFSPRDFNVGFFEVPFDTAFARELATAATRIWREHVMVGVLPEATEVPNLTPEDPEIRHLVYKAVSLKEIENETKRRFQDTLGQLAQYFTGARGLATGKAAFLAADFTRSRTYDEEILIGMAQSHGLDPETYYTEDAKIDPAKAVEMLDHLYNSLNDRQALTGALKQLQENGTPKVKNLEAALLAQDLADMGVDVAPAFGVKTKFAVSRKKKGIEAEQVGRIKDTAFELVDTLEELHDVDLREQLAEIANHGIVVAADEPEDPGEEIREEDLVDLLLD